MTPPSIHFTTYSSSVEETLALAAELVQSIQGRGIISLEGPLGAGKTHFVKGIAAALEIKEEVTSPTFTLLHSYGANEKRLHHLDFYRLKEEAEAIDLGLEDYFSESLTIIEWGNKFPLLLPPETIRVIIKPRENEVREISYILPHS
ncbi:MAG: tRNA (adenosine(37)-N6)-threonylcarbamoyltransferase complex ATPase subunit type 1 TsaE [Chthoniobacterales bacterium]